MNRLGQVGQVYVGFINTHFHYLSKYSQSICSQVCVGFQNTHLTIFQILLINLQLINFFDQSIPRSIGILTNLSIPGQSVILCQLANSKFGQSTPNPFFQPKASLSSFSLEKEVSFKFSLRQLFLLPIFFRCVGGSFRNSFRRNRKLRNVSETSR